MHEGTAGFEPARAAPPPALVASEKPKLPESICVLLVNFYLSFNSILFAFSLAF